MSALSAGTRLGPYEILARIGAGGMGEVYRARDTRLDRTVAVKVLPTAISANAEARARFEREARAISALNDPRICTLHDVGSEGDIAYLVMELLDGETLAGVQTRGKLPLERALRYAIEIATALDSAHRQGIVHRDLKPGNIMITRAGVKLLDFGLARLTAAPASGHDAPTIVSPITSEGMIMGTLQYMAPEQLEGKTVDARADLFAFGCIVYEMVTGRRAFTGGSQASLITAIMSTDPPPMASQESLAPPALERLVRKCLEKSADDRWQNAGDLATELRWIAEAPEVAATATQRRGARLLPWIIAAAAVIGGIAAASLLARRESAKEPLRLTFSSNADRTPFNDLDSELVVSRDGRYVMYTGVKGGQSSLWLRDVRNATAAPIPNTEGAASPFWSPDSRKVAFVRNGKLVRTTIAGEDTATICAVPPGTYVHGAWGHDGTIVISYLGQRLRMLRVPASGGTPQDIVPRDTPPQTTFVWPSFIGDSDEVAYCTIQRGADAQLHVLSLSDGTHRALGPIDSRVEIVDGYMLFVRDGGLYAQKVDAGVKRIGEPVLLQSAVRNYSSIGSATFSASPSLLAFAGSDMEARATWFDRSGTILGTIGPNGIYGLLRISHDGRKLVLSAVDPASGTSDLWVSDLARNTSMRITNTPLGEDHPAWSPDDQTLAYSFEEDGPPHVFAVRATGGKPAMITERRGIQTVSDWSPDGKIVFFSELNASTKHDLMMVEPKPDAKPVAWLQTPFFEGDARISPDGKWVAFVSDASGRREVYVAPFDDPAARVQISVDGGDTPVWPAGGKELFFRSNGKLFAAPVRFQPSFDAGTPQLLFGEAGGADWGGYDVTADGQRIIIARTTSGPQTNPINVIVNWKSLIEKK